MGLFRFDEILYIKNEFQEEIEEAIRIILIKIYLFMLIK